MSLAKPLLASALIAALAFAALPVDAASAKPTARASGALEVYDRPGYGPFRTLLDVLKNNERVYVLSCTRHQRYCQVKQLDGGPTGWVDGSYLVGAAAKNAVTPFEFTFDPMDPLDLFHHKHP